jgi:ABC-2 type transport system permease protein
MTGTNPLIVLMRHHWRQHRLPLIPMAVGLALFQFLMTRLAPAPNEIGFMATIMATLPPQLVALAGGQAAFGTPAGVLSIGYEHPFFFLMLSAWVVRVPSAALAGEIGRGTMDLVAARPIARWQHLAAAALFTGAGAAILIGAAWLSTTIGLAIRSLGVSGLDMLPIALMAWLLFMTWGLVSLLVSAQQREAGGAIAWTSGIIAASFVLEYLSRLWKPISGLRPVSLFSYYRPELIISAGLAWHDIIRLTLVAVAAALVTLAMFKRRDL